MLLLLFYFYLFHVWHSNFCMCWTEFLTLYSFCFKNFNISCEVHLQVINSIHFCLSEKLCFSLTCEEGFCWNNSELTVFSSGTLKMLLHCLVLAGLLMRSLLSFLSWFLCGSCIFFLWLTSRFSLSLVFSRTVYTGVCMYKFVFVCMYVCVFIMLGIPQLELLEYGLVSVTNFGKFLAIISPALFFFSPLGIWISDHLILSYRFWTNCSSPDPRNFCLSVFSLSNFYWFFLLMDSFLSCVQSTDKPITCILHLFFISQIFMWLSLLFLSP